jgi:hypothetical protein
MSKTIRIEKVQTATVRSDVKPHSKHLDFGVPTQRTKGAFPEQIGEGAGQYKYYSSKKRFDKRRDYLKANNIYHQSHWYGQRGEIITY